MHNCESNKLWPQWIKWCNHLRRVQESGIQNTPQLLLYIHFLSCSHAWLTLTMEAKGSYKELLHVYQTTQYHIPKDHSLDTNMRKSYLTWINHISEAGKLAIMMTFTGSQTEETATPQICVLGQDDSLPPQLQYLVQRALDEIKQEAKKGS